MRETPLDNERRASLIGQFKTIRRREVIFSFFGCLLVLAGFFTLTLTFVSWILIAFGALLFCAAYGMRQERRLTKEQLASAGPAAIGPLIEALYFDRTADGDVVTETRAQAAAEIYELLGSASRQHLLTLTDQEAECFYRAYANWSDDFPEYQLLVLDHLIACLDVRAIPWVVRLIETPSISKYSNAVKQRALICDDVLADKYIREKASSVLLRAAPGSSPLLRPADGSTTGNSKLESILVRPSSDE